VFGINWLEDSEIGDDRVILFAGTAGLLLVACGKNTVGNIAPSFFQLSASSFTSSGALMLKNHKITFTTEVPEY